ncbi:MAG: hypothetical protein LR120_04180 [Dehalococcoidia bacterium]|nr:hypothetical protein [Dehalococcoidia bacterium]MAX19762.1 hypothetical protein [Chloroflexota bacterium]MCD5398921.1 hypothetical protein [Dehalococcoidia bacterium]
MVVNVVVPPAPGSAPLFLLQGDADVTLLPPPMYLGLIAQERSIVISANLLANDPVNMVVRSDIA